jgi:hypothetical protein
MSEKYRYRLRPGYKSKKLLIKIWVEGDIEIFKTHLWDALSEIEPVFLETQDLWMNDEKFYKLDSKVGKFEMSYYYCIDDINFWGEDNQEGILKIESILAKSPHFWREEVDYNDYN